MKTITEAMAYYSSLLNLLGEGKSLIALINELNGCSICYSLNLKKE